MRIAVFTPYLPYPPDTGGKIRSYHLLRALTNRFDVDLYTVYYGDEPSQAAVDALREHCREVALFRLKGAWRTRDRIRRMLAPLPRPAAHFHTPDSLKQAQAYLQDGDYDLLVADEMCMTPYAELAPELPKITIRHKVDYMHYREMADARPWGLEKLLDYVEAIKLRRYSQEKMPLYQAFVACSEEDAAMVHQDAPDVPALVIPNGADLRKFEPSERSGDEEPILLYVGSMNYYPNIDAMQFFFEKMFDGIRQEMPSVRVQVVGHAPPPEIESLARLPRVEVTGSVPDVVPYYDRAMAFVVPLRLGGGTRLKIIEAMAMGLPVVSTSVGAEGVDVKSEENILIADEAASFTACVLRLLSDPELRADIAEAGRRLAKRYDWRELTKPYPDLAELLVHQRRQR